MPLTLACHPESGALLRALGAWLDAQPRPAAGGLPDPVWIVCPTRRLARAVQARLAADRARLALHFLDPLALVERLEDRLRLTPGRPLGALTARLLLRRVLAGLAGTGSLPRHQDMAPALLPAFQDLREAGVEDRPAPAGLGAAARLCLDAFRQWRAAVVDAGCEDDVGRADAVTRSLADRQETALPCIAWFGFAEMVARYRRLLRALAGRTTIRAFLFAQGREPAPELTAAETLVEALRAQASSVERLGDPAGPGVKSCSASLRGPRAEWEEALWRVADAWRRGTPLEDQAIVVRRLADYEGVLLPAAARLGFTGLLDSPFRVPLLRHGWCAPALNSRGPEDHAAREAALEACGRREAASALKEAWGDAASGVRIPGAPDWADCLREALLLHGLRPFARADGGGLQVLDFQQARGLRFSHVVLAGVHRGVVPRPVREDPFLRDEVRARLSQDLADPLPSRAFQAEDEHALLNLALRTARSRLCLLRQHADQDGSTVAPSPLQREMERWLDTPLGFQPQASEPVAAARRRVKAGAALADEGVIALGGRPAAWKEAGRLAKKNETVALRLGGAPAWLEVVESCHGPDLGFDGAVDDAAGELPGELRVTAFEQYGRSPMAFFFETVLAVPALEGWRAPGPTPRERGTAVHEVLEAAWKLGAAATPGARRAAAAEACKRLLAPLYAGGDSGTEAFLAHEHLRWRTALERFMEWDVSRLGRASKDRRLKGGPFSVEPDDAERPLQGVLELEGGLRLGLRGKIDRILRSRDELRISDFKSGSVKKVSDPASLLRGTALQNALYLFLLAAASEAGDVRHSLEAVRVSPDCDYSASTAAQGGTGSSTTADEWERIAAGVRETVSVLARQLQAGHFPPLAESWDPWFATMRLGHEATRRRVDGHPEWHEFALLRKKKVPRKDGSGGLCILEEVRAAAAGEGGS